MASNTVPNSITNNIVDHLALSVEDLMKDLKCPAAVCVYRVPKPSSLDNPIAFTPQFVGLGPYHHRLPHLSFNYLKWSAVMSMLNNTSVLTKFVEELSKSNPAPLIRDYYDSNLEFKDDTLLHLMTVDALFLYHFLSNFGTEFDPPDGMPRVNDSGAELTKDAIIRDVLMLENQIPIHTLHQIIAVFTNMETDEPCVHVDKKHLDSKMLDFCIALCPLVNIDKKLSNHVHHLLDLMYHLVVSKPDPDDENVERGDKDDQYSEAPKNVPLQGLMSTFYHVVVLGTMPKAYENVTESEKKDRRTAHKVGLFLYQYFRKMYRMMVLGIKVNFNDEPEPEPKLDLDENAKRGDEDNHRSPQEKEPLMTSLYCFPIRTCLFALSFLNFVSFVVSFTLVIAILYVIIYFIGLIFSLNVLIAKLIIRVLEYLVKPIVYLIGLCYPLVVMTHGVLASIALPFVVPITGLVRQVMCVFEFVQKSTNSDMDVKILSVKELHQAEINFQPSDGGISSIQYDEANCNFYLPKIGLDVNSEVIIKNLVAYESLTKSDCLIFTRYVELMRALIKTVEDVKLLVHEKIIMTELSDSEIVQLFNGMRKSIRPTNTPELEHVIIKVNAKLFSFNSQKLQRFITKYVYPFLRCIAFVAAIGFWILLDALFETILQGKMSDIIKYITSIRIFEWLSFS